MKGFLLVLSLLLPLALLAQSRVAIKGKVTDAKNRPIEFATVTVAETRYATYTDTAGNFQFQVDPRQYPALTIHISVVNKLGISKSLKKTDYQSLQHFVLEELSLNLKEVVVSARQKTSDISNSAIVFDRQALDQLQAYSLADVLNNLPGKTTTAPNLDYNQMATLRTAASGDPTQQNINSMGVAIYIDGIRLSNDANMQNKNIGLWGTSRGVINNHEDPAIGKINAGQYDTPFGGLDLRNIPVDNIERIEIVSGVASAKYGEMTDGAIFITTKASRTPYNVSMRLNGSSVNASLSKGFSLGKNAGDVNANINYLNSVQDPTNSLKAYGRVTGGLKWTKAFSHQLTNTFSTDFSYKIDNAKIDPDDPFEETTYSKERRIAFSNRTALQSDSKWFTGANLNLSYDGGYQETYRQRYMNGAPLAVADKDTTGIYEGYYAPGNYYATENIIGKPWNSSASLDLNSLFRTGSLSHQLAYGVSMSASGNTGQGVISDPKRPPTNSGSSSSLKSDRPYDFDLQRPLLNFGFYAEDRVKFDVFKKEFNITGGLRYDLQNGYPSVEPRINAGYQLSKRWSLRAAYGISTKAPSMSYRYPAPTYFDIPLLNVGNGDANQSLYLVYTRKVLHDNSTLKPSRSSQMELGVNADYGLISSSLYGYYKKNTDGFSSAAQYLPIYLPVYSYTVVTGQKPVAVNTGQTKLYAGLSDIVIGNNVRSDNYGLEWYVTTRKIKAIQTSFNWNTSVAYTKYNNSGTVVMPTTDARIQQGATAWYGIYPASFYQNTSIVSKLGSDTHIPDLGFVVSFIVDISWRNVKQYLGKSTYPVAYIDKNGNTVPIQVFDPNNSDYNYLVLTPDAATKIQDPPFAYANLSMRLAKEIKKKVRVSLFAYNFLDTKIQYVNPVTNNYTVYNSPVSVGAEVTFKF